MRKLFLLLTVCVLSHTMSWADDIEINIDIEAIVDVPLNLYPTMETGESSWDYLFAYTSRKAVIKNSIVKEYLNYNSDAFILSDESAFSVTANRHSCWYEGNEYNYFDYVIIPKKEGFYILKHSLRYANYEGFDPVTRMEKYNTREYDITYNINVKPLINYLYSTDFSGGAGAQVSLPIFMENKINVRDFQFDLVLPDGITVATKEGNIDASVTDRTTSYTFEGRTLSSGVTRVMAYTLSDALVSGTEGAVMNMKLNIDKETPLGEYDIKITNVQLSEKNGANINTVYAPERTFKLEVRAVAKGDVNADGVVNVTDISSIISYILEERPTWFTESVADVNGDGQIDVTDVIAIIDIIMSE